MSPTIENSSIYSRSGKLLYRKYREFFLPTILAALSSSMAIIVDSIIVGNMLGPKEMASVNLCIPVMQFIGTLSILVGMGASALIAAAIGRRDETSANTTFTTSVILILGSGILMTALTIPFYGEIARLLTPDIELQPLVGDFLSVLLTGTVFLMLIPLFSYIMRTDGMAKLASKTLIVANVTNLLLDLLFIGPCDMGIAGSSLATVCGYIVSTGLLLFYWRSPKRTLRFNLSENSNIKAFIRNTGKIVKTGSPGAISSALIVVKVFCINLLIAHIAGSSGLIVFSVCFSALSFLSMFISGTAGTMMPIVGVLFGQRDFRGMRLVFNYTLRLALLLTAGIVVLMELFPVSVFELFGVNSPELLSIGVPSLRLYALSLGGVTVTFIMIYYYMTIQQQKVANTLSIIEGLVVVVPLAWLFSQWMGLLGVWLAFIVAEAVALGILFLQVRGMTKKSGGRYADLLLVERSEPGLLYDISLSGSQQEAARLSADARKVLKSCDICTSIALQAGIALEEMVDHARQHNKRVDIDVRITSTEDSIVISMRDNGAWFNPLNHKPQQDELSIDGITLLKTIASEIKYNRVLDLNQTLIILPKHS